MRLPDAVASLPLTRATLNLFASVWERRYEHVYSRSETLFNIAQQEDFSHTEVTRVFTSLVTVFIGKCGVRNPPMLHCYVSGRVFPPTDSRTVVQSIYHNPLCDCPSVSRSVCGGTPFLYVTHIKLDYYLWLREHSLQLKWHQKKVGISMQPPL